ncbi:MAG: hypothetical protein Q4G21_09980 [Dermabacter sp.]|nr:hypothetical protein [Dermabacter sp.]
MNARERRAEARVWRRRARRGRNHGLNSRTLRLSRLITFAVLAVPLLALGLLTGKFVSMPVLQAYALSAYGGGDFAVAGERSDLLQHGNVFEPYLPSLTKGTALLAAGDATAAQPLLETSLQAWTNGSDLNQPAHAQCKIRNNLAIAMTMNAEAAPDAAAKADALYAAEEVLAPCMSGGGSSENNEDQESTDANGEEIRERREQADSEAGNDPRESPTDEDSTGGQEENPENDPRYADPEGEGEDGQSPTPDPGEQQREEELEQRNKGTGDGGDPDGDQDGDPDGGGVKPW